MNHLVLAVDNGCGAKVLENSYPELETTCVMSSDTAGLKNRCLGR